MLGAVFDDTALFADLVEYEPTRMDISEKSINELNEIAGGDYWQPIIESYKKQEINGYDAEALFAEEYCTRLRRSYTYVLNMPLRIKRGQRPKYRLIHATNHRDGCLLMVDNICNRWEALQEIQSGGQMLLWAENVDNQAVDEDDIEEKTIDHFSQYNKPISLHDALAMFFMKYGPICSTGTVRTILKKLEGSGRLSVDRNPALTGRGKKATFMTEGKGKKVSVRWIR